MTSLKVVNCPESIANSVFEDDSRISDMTISKRFFRTKIQFRFHNEIDAKKFKETYENTRTLGRWFWNYGNTLKITY